MGEQLAMWGWDEANKVWRKLLVGNDGRLRISDDDPFEIVQDTPENMKHLPHGYYAGGPAYLPLAVNVDGKLLVELSSLAHLGDIADLDLTGIADGDVLYWDAAAEEWKVNQFLPLAGGTMTGPLKIGDATYIQIGHSDGHGRLIPWLGAEGLGGFLMQAGDGDRIGWLALQPKGTEHRSQFTLYNSDAGVGLPYSVLNIEVDEDIARIFYESAGGPETEIAHLQIKNTLETFDVIAMRDEVDNIGSSSNKYWSVYALRHIIQQNIDTNLRWSGITAPMTAGTNLTARQAVRVGGDSRMELAKADAVGTMPAIALAALIIDEDAEGEFLLQGFFRDDTWDWTPGGLLYVSKDTAGALTQTLPAVAGEYVQVVGIAITATIIHFNPSYELVKVS